MVSQEEWAEAAATKTLDMAEMDALVQKSVEKWADYEAKKKISGEAFAAAEQVDLEILEALKQAGKSKYHVDDLGTVSIDSKAIVRVPSNLEAKKKFFDHLHEVMSEDAMFSLLTVNSNTLNAWYKSALDEASSKGILGFSVPGIEQPTMREGLRFTKARLKKGDK